MSPQHAGRIPDLFFKADIGSILFSHLLCPPVSHSGSPARYHRLLL
jgi:hypothetical protein